MNLEKTNFSRRYRPAQFNDFVEQELVVRMLKNTLFQNHLFPVYLFSGQRGCGKTTLARLFATALNCEKRSEFTANPHQTELPCLACRSCKAAHVNRHPDICEIDAASYTGVDHVRVLTESASFLPVLGSVKIYLIDEAHMLSKAAFNALLKLLEEPPTTVVCMLVTTDIEKIIPTVRSRSFQLLMRPLSEIGLINLLERVCKKESISFEQSALEHIARVSQGSGRDALNLLEQVLRSAGTISLQAVRRVRSEIDERTLEDLLNLILDQKSPSEICTFLEMHPEIARAPQVVWYQLCNATRNIVVKKQDHSHASRAFKFMKHLYSHELAFLKTVYQYAFFEMVLLTAELTDKALPPSSTPTTKNQVIVKSDQQVEHLEKKVSSPAGSQSSDNWQKFITQIEETNDQLLISLFDQAQVKEEMNTTSVKITLLFDKDMQFLHDLLEQKRTIWKPILEEIFGKKTDLETRFVLDAFVANKMATRFKEAPRVQKSTESLSPAARSAVILKTKKQNTSDNSVQQNVLSEDAQELLRIFPGTVTTVQNDE